MRRKPWPKEHYDYLREIAAGRYNDEITKLMNEKFGTNYTENQIRNAKVRKGIQSGVPRRRPDPDAGLFTREQKEFIRQNVEGRTNQELADLVNEKFGLSITAQQMNTYKSNHGLRSGLDFRFKKGNIPANKGKKFPGRINRTSFKKGNKPKNYKPIGTERIDRDGYVLIKVRNEGPWHKRWRRKHKVIWEEAYGPIPKSHALIFLNKNKQNITLENLKLITRAELVRMNQNKLFYTDPELTKTGVAIASLQTKIGELTRKGKDK